MRTRLLGFMCYILVTVPAFSQFVHSYTLTLSPGDNLIANQLDNGSNTADLVLSGIQDGDMLMLGYNSQSGTFATNITYMEGQFYDQQSGQVPPPVLAPGIGFDYVNESGSPESMTFTGIPHVPVLPVNLANGTGSYYLLSRQTNDVGSYVNVTGYPPEQGAQVVTPGPSGSVMNIFNNGAWSLGSPSLAVGQAAFFLVTTTNVQTYGVRVNSGLSLIANQLDHGSNTLAEVFANVPDGSALYKYNNASGTWSNSFYSAALGAWFPADITLSPGEGAFFQSPTNFMLTFTGTPHVPVLPLSIPSGSCYLLSRQTNDVGNWLSLAGTLPTDGVQIYRWASSNQPQNYVVATYSGTTGWSSGGSNGPTLAVGESAWLANGAFPPVPNTNSFVIFDGLLNESLGHATMTVVSNQGSSGLDGDEGLIVTNLGSGGQDGVSIAMKPGCSFAGSWMPLDPSNSLPVGAYVQSQIIGSTGGGATGAGVTDGVLASTTCTKAGTDNYLISVDYSPLGSFSQTVQVYNGTVLVAQVSGQANSLVATTTRPPGTCTINPILNQEWPVPTSISINGGPTVMGTEILMIPEGAAPIASVTGEQILAANIPAITITNEIEPSGTGVSLVYQGLINSSLGYAAMSTDCCVTNLGSGGQDGLELVVTNLGSGGQDGVSIALPSYLSALDVLCQDIDPNNTLPIGEYMQSAVVGTSGAVTNGALAMVRMTKAGSGSYVVTADFTALGATDCLVQAYLNGTLVGQGMTNTSAGIIVITKTNVDGSSHDVELDDQNCYKSSTIDFSVSTLMQLPGGANVNADHVWLTPLHIPPVRPSAFQITSSQAASLTIIGEEVSLVYQGLTNTSVGNATLTMGCCISNLGSSGQDGVGLIVTNLGSSGQDGVTIALNPGENFAGGWQPLDPNDLLPAGASVQSAIIGNAGQIENGLLGSVTCTKEQTSNYVFTVDYSPLGSFSHTVQVYNGSNLVAQVNGQGGTEVATATLPPGTCTINPYLNQEWPFPTSITLDGGPTVMGTELLMIPEGGTPIVSVLAARILAANIPSIIFTNEGPEKENLVYQGLTNTSLGGASVTVITNLGSGGQDGVELIVTNLGSSGQDGVSIALPGSAGLDVHWQPLDPGSNLPPGTFVQENVIGTMGGVANEVLGSVTMTELCGDCGAGNGSNFVISADFSPIGARTYTVQAFLGGSLVAQANGQNGSALAYCNIWGDSGCTPLPPVLGGGWDWTNGPDEPLPLLTVDGQGAVQCDHLYILPENVSGTATALQLTASQIPAITVTSENVSLVYQGLTNTAQGGATVITNIGGNGQDGVELIITNLGSGGQDGVSVALPGYLAGLTLSCPPSTGTNTPPVGSYFQSRLVGTVGGSANTVLATETVTAEGGGEFFFSADDTALGTSTYTLHAYLHGVLVSQATGQNGPVLAQANCGPGSMDYFFPERSVHFPTNAQLSFAGAASVLCDELDIIPQNAAPYTASAFQVVASGVSSFTIAQESASLVYMGLTNTSQGRASVAPTCCISNLGSSGQDGVGLIVTNLGSGGQDGVAITLNAGDNFAGSWLPLDPGNSLPVGASIRSEMIGTAGNITNGVLGSILCTKGGTSNYGIAVDYSPLGSTTHTIQVFNGTNLVTQLTGQVGAVCAITQLPPGTCTINPWLNQEWPEPVQLNLGGGVSFTGTEILVIPEGATPVSSVSGAAILAANIPSITFVDESTTVNYGGLDVTALGDADLAISCCVTNLGSGGQDGLEMIVTNLGSSGQDGVSISLPSSTALDLDWSPLDAANLLPVGAYVQEHLIGAIAGIANQTLGTVTMTKLCGTCGAGNGSNLVISADFSPVGAKTYTVQAFLNGALVTQATHLSGPSLAYCDIWGDSGCIPLPPPLGGGWDWTNGPGDPLPSVTILGRAAVQCDHLYILPEKVSGTATALQITASQVPSINVEAATVSPLAVQLTQSRPNLTLHWLGTGVLQVSSNLTTWSAVTNATSPHTVPIGPTNQYFRIHQTAP